MGSAKEAALEQSDRNYDRNRYYHERKKLKDRIRMYQCYPGFVAKFTSELAALERDWKNRRGK